MELIEDLIDELTVKQKSVVFKFYCETSDLFFRWDYTNEKALLAMTKEEVEMCSDAYRRIFKELRVFIRKLREDGVPELADAISDMLREVFHTKPSKH